MQAATKAVGNMAFDEGSFIFYAGWTHYNGWGTIAVNEDATSRELSNNLTRKFYYKKEFQWFKIEPDGP